MPHYEPHHHAGDPHLPPRPTGLEPATPRWQIDYITTEGALRGLIRECLAEPRVAIDTETFNWIADKGNGPTRENVGQLALLQLGIPAREYAALVHVRVLAANGIDWASAVRPLLESAGTEKIVHFGRFERAVFENYDLPFDAGVRDTCAMAKAVFGELQQYYPGLEKRSLQSLSRHLLGRDISKAEQQGDWSTFELTPAQRDYAALDVEIAAEVYGVLERFFRVTGRDPAQVNWRV